MRSSMATTLCIITFLCCTLFISSSSAHDEKKLSLNPADALVAIVNSNRTAHKAASLYSNPGLGCLALQYIKAYQGKCDEVGGPNAKKPADSEFAETFAPNCGVVATTPLPNHGPYTWVPVQIRDSR
ncbi:hypothetical protein OSB04_014788 [Centaurea solstitialis]|uniref:Uncharacterized protein n=1 Tax=Centaurea solstitialis TaxID=347529 RepID=A0AA38T5J3_9ASTR|nr:hypothetical protein OSB04_014788 [Centaurea solstitialis]